MVYFIISMKIQVLFIFLWLSERYCHESRSDEARHSHHSHKNAFKEMFYWDNVEFQFPSDCARNESLTTGSYIPRNNVIWAMGVWNDKIFVSVFRVGVGVSSSLNYFSKKSTTKSPVLIPYPTYEANYVSEAAGRRTSSLASNSSVICAGYFRIDRCDRLWVIDAGFDDFFGEHRSVAPPALVIFDLKTDKLVRRYTIPAEFVSEYTGFVNLDIDMTGKDCDNVYAYIADMFRSIVVYSFKENRSWRVTHNLFGSDPDQGYFYFGKIQINWNFGTVGLAVGEHHRDGSRRVYINPFSSTRSYYISNRVLQNETYIALNDYYYDVHLLGDRGKHGQIFTWAYDEKTNVLFDNQFYRQQVGCWNTASSYRSSNYSVVFRREELFFPEDIYIDRNRNLWILSNNFPVFLRGNWKSNIKNIRMFKAKVDDVISGTICKHRSKHPNHY